MSFAVTEPDAGNDITHIKTFARREGDNLHHQRPQSLHHQGPGREEDAPADAHHAHRTGHSSKTDGMTLFFADLDRDAVEVRELHKLGRHAVDTNMLFIDNLKVSAADIIGEEGRAFTRLLDGLNPERILIAAEGIGMGRAAIERRSATPRSASFLAARSARTRPSRIRSLTPTPSSKSPS